MNVPNEYLYSTYSMVIDIKHPKIISNIISREV